ncbi:hypothetical protein [Sagittula sp. SSi028]|uniref:hypothetical protein n=1 Tax=Sagittula sp. SSi028 TaxID=3400636 RepID=UPI003AF4E76F
MTYVPPIRPLLIAGALGQIAFELYAWLISPWLFGVTLEPANLVMGLGKQLLGLSYGYPIAFALHVALGVVGFAALVWAAWRVLPRGWTTAGAITGVALWFIAQGFLAQIVGRDFMMGFGAYTQSSFVGHVGMTLVIAAVFARLQGRAAVA